MDLEDLQIEGIRDLMADEVDLDIAENRLYTSKRLKPGFRDMYTTLLKDAIVDGDPNSFAQCILNEKCLVSVEPSSRSKTGMKKVPWNAHIVLGEGEFNRFFIRALCRKAIEEGYKLEIYRAKEVNKPRSISKSLIGTEVDPNVLLNDLRENIGVDTALGVPPGPSSGLSVRLIK